MMGHPTTLFLYIVMTVIVQWQISSVITTDSRLTPFMFPKENWMYGGTNSDIRIHVHVDTIMTRFNYTKVCDVFNTQTGVIFIEALLFIADRITRDNLLDGQTLGILVVNTCKDPKKNPYLLLIDNSMLVVGPYSSELSEFTTKFLTIFKFSEVSYGASTPKLINNKEEYPEFFTTVPSDDLTGYVYLDLALSSQWEYTGLLYSSNEDGGSLAVNLMQKLYNSQYCNTQHQISNDATIEEYQMHIKNMITNPNLKVIFLFFSFKGCRDFFEAATIFGEQLKSKIFVLASRCGTMVDIPHSIRKYLVGMMTVQTTDPQPKEFQEYFGKLNSSNNPRNPFFPFYWEATHGCTTGDQNATNYCDNVDTTYFNKYASVRPLINAVYTSVYSIMKGFEFYCSNRTADEKRNCYKRKKSSVKRNLDKYIPSMNFKLFNSTFRFNENGEVTESFDIFQYGENNHGKYAFHRVGFWNYTRWARGETALRMNEQVNITDSKCSLPCGEREITEYYALRSCCWNCKSCPLSSIIVNNTCLECSLGSKASADQTRCNKLPILTITRNSPISIAVICMSSFGYFVIAIILFIFIQNFSSHIIKSSSRELALFSLFGLALMLLTSIVLALQPTIVVCYSQKILIGVSLTCCYAPLVLKTNRIYRIFASSSKFKLKRLMLVSNRSQFLMIMAMIGIELLMGVFWILTDKPVITTTYPSDEDHVLRECLLSGTGGVLNLIFPIGLMIACTFWAFKTRNLPEIFSEIKSIGATMYITLFLVTVAFAMMFILQSINIPFTTIYVVCFTFQAIVFVNLIGQYAMKIKTLFLKGNLDDEKCAQTEVTTVVMSNRFISPNASPKGSNGTRQMSLVSEIIPHRLSGSISSTFIGSPNSNVKRFSYDY